MRATGVPVVAGSNRPVWVRSLMAATLVAVSTAGFGGTFSGSGYLVPLGLGVIGAAGAAEFGRRRQWLLGESVGVSLILFCVLGGLATRSFPSPSAYASFFEGLVGSWASLVTSAPPTDLTPTLRVVPYAVAWLSTLIASELSHRASQPLALMLGPLTALAVTTPLTIEDAPTAKVQGVALAVGALVLSVQRFGGGAALLALVVVAAPLVGPRLPLAERNERFDLRQPHDRPWSPLDVPSPLVTLKASLKDGRSSEVVFTVNADQPLTRFNLAVLDAYDGVVWAVGPEGDSRFQPVDTTLPQPPSGIEIGQSTNYSLRVGTLSGPWVPVAGWPTETSLIDLRLNTTTGTLASPDGFSEGDSWTMATQPRPELTELELRRLTTQTDDAEAELDLVPPRLRDLAGDTFEGESPGVSRTLALAGRFVDDGFYDHGDTARPGHSLARLEEFLTDPDRLIGYAEQYAASAGVLSRIGGTPTRVVVGYVIPVDRYHNGSAAVRADDIAAWIEIKTVERGWVPITVTPDRSREPEAEQLGVTTRDVAVPNPPPPPPPPPDLAPPARSEETDQDADQDDEIADDQSILASVPRVAVVGAGAVGFPLVTLAAATGGVIAAKRRRTNRRRNGSTDAQIAGAWSELGDRYREAGWPTNAARTPTEAIAALVQAEPAALASKDALQALADSVDDAAFSPFPPDQQAADKAWVDCRAAVDSLHRGRSRWQRFCLRTDPRPLFPSTRPKQKRRPASR